MFGATVIVWVGIAVQLVSVFRAVPGPVYSDLPINCHRHEPVSFRVLELDNLMPLARQLPQRLGFSGFCSMARYSRLSVVKASVLSWRPLVRRTGTDFPSTSTAFAGHHLLGNRSQERNFEHIPACASTSDPERSS
jgi:hypothetical protein